MLTPACSALQIEQELPAEEASYEIPETPNGVAA